MQTEKKKKEIKPKNTRKRLRNPAKWKRNKSAMLRERGLEFWSIANKESYVRKVYK